MTRRSLFLVVLAPAALTAADWVYAPQPEYPAIARKRGIHGQVRFQATVRKDGTIRALRLISGHPVLTPAAAAAARTWRAKPGAVERIAPIVITFQKDITAAPLAQAA